MRILISQGFNHEERGDSCHYKQSPSQQRYEWWCETSHLSSGDIFWNRNNSSLSLDCMSIHAYVYICIYVYMYIYIYTIYIPLYYIYTYTLYIYTLYIYISVKNWLLASSPGSNCYLKKNKPAGINCFFFFFDRKNCRGKWVVNSSSKKGCENPILIR